MLKIIGNEREIKCIKSVLWCSTDCPILENPYRDCTCGRKCVDDVDAFYDCIESNIEFHVTED